MAYEEKIWAIFQRFTQLSYPPAATIPQNNKCS